MIENTASVQDILLYPNYEDVPALNDKTIEIFQNLCPIINTSESSLELKDVRPLNKIADEIKCYRNIISSKIIEKCRNKIKLLKIAYIASIVFFVIASSLNSNNASLYAITELIILFSIAVSGANTATNTNRNLPVSDQFYIHNYPSIDAIAFPFFDLFLNSSELNTRDILYFESKIQSLIEEFNTTKPLLKKYFEENLLTFHKKLQTFLKQINTDIANANKSYMQFRKTIMDDLETQKLGLETAKDDLIKFSKYLDA